MKLINLKLEFLEVFIMIINIVLVLIMDMDGSLNQKKNVFIILDKLVVLKALLTASRREENRRRTKFVDGFQKYKYNMNEDKPITISAGIKLMFPYFVIICITWLLLLIGWYIIGLPIGPGVYPTV